MNELKLGARVRIAKMEVSENYDYDDATGLEGVVVGYDETNEYPWYVEVEPKPDGAYDAPALFYPELYKTSELEVLEA